MSFTKACYYCDGLNGQHRDACPIPEVAKEQAEAATQRSVTYATSKVSKESLAASEADPSAFGFYGEAAWRADMETWTLPRDHGVTTTVRDVDCINGIITLETK